MLHTVDMARYTEDKLQTFVWKGIISTSDAEKTSLTIVLIFFFFLFVLKCKQKWNYYPFKPQQTKLNLSSIATRYFLYFFAKSMGRAEGQNNFELVILCSRQISQTVCRPNPLGVNYCESVRNTITLTQIKLLVLRG